MFSRIFTRLASSARQQKQQLSSTASSFPVSGRGKLLAVGIVVVGGAAALWYTSRKPVLAYGYVEECLHPPKYPWEHNKLWKAYDHAAIRRGFVVYNTVGVACHSMRYRYYRQLVDVAFTEEEMKEFAANFDDYDSEPNDEGDVLKRVGLINDRMHIPYDNDKQARATNNGALPPDLSQIVRARDGGENYLFSLLTGYRDPPQGVVMSENMYYNIYFPGCQLAMPPPLAQGAVQDDDGNDYSISQQAKDISIYLAWSSYMEHDERHLMGMKTLATMTILAIPFFYWKKFRWSYLIKRKVEFLRRKKLE